MLSNNLLPKSAMQVDAHSKLSSILLDIQKGFQAYTDKVSRSYDIDNMEYEDLMKLITSYSLADLYGSLPPYYKGSDYDSFGKAYGPKLKPLDKTTFARVFIRCMLKMRKDVGAVEMFDTIMGMLGVPEDKYVVLQTFQYYDKDTNEYRFFKRRLYTSPRAGNIFSMYSAVPLTHQVFKVDVTTSKPYPIQSYYTPTQTITVDVLTNLASALGSEFIIALRNIAMFMKPNHVVIEDLVPTIYLYSSGFYNISLSRRGDKTITPAEAQYPVPFSLNYTSATSDFQTYSGANGLVSSTLNFETEGIIPGMLLSMTGWTDPANNVIGARIIDVSGSGLQVDTRDATFADEIKTGTGVTITIDYDHSFQDGLVTFDPLNKSYASALTVTANPAGGRITRASGSFITDGFKVGSYLQVLGFANAINNFDILQKGKITNITALTITTDRTVMINESPSTTVTLAQYQIDDTRRDGIATRGPNIEQRSDTLTPVIYQNSIIPTLDTGGSYGEPYSVYRTGALDSMHNNDLNPKAGGAIFFGKVVSGTFGVDSGAYSRATGSFIDEGFEVDDLISVEGFSIGGNNINKIKVTAVYALELDVATFLSAEIPTAVKIHLEMKRSY